MNSNTIATLDLTLPFDPKTVFHTNYMNIKFKSLKSLKIFYLNARSIAKKIDELEIIIDNITKKNNTQIDIIAVTEHWIRDYDAKFFSFGQYNAVFSSRPDKGGGGSAIFVHKSIDYTIKNVFSDNSNSFLTINIKTQNINITCIYRQTEYTNVAYEQFFDQLENHLQINCMSGTNYIIGDFNIDVMENTQITNEYLSLMERNGFFICDTKSNTRPISNSNLDHVFTNDFKFDMQLNTFSYDRHDHKLMFIEIDNNIGREKLNRNTHRRIDYEMLDNAIRNDNAFSANSQQITTYEQFITKLQSHVSACTTNTKLKRPNKNAKPFVDKELV